MQFKLAEASDTCTLASILLPAVLLASEMDSILLSLQNSGTASARSNHLRARGGQIHPPVAHPGYSPSAPSPAQAALTLLGNTGPRTAPHEGASLPSPTIKFKQTPTIF